MHESRNARVNSLFFGSETLQNAGLIGMSDFESASEEEGCQGKDMKKGSESPTSTALERDDESRPEQTAISTSQSRNQVSKSRASDCQVSRGLGPHQSIVWRRSKEVWYTEKKKTRENKSRLVQEHE
jgi:hypothetical protein